jgi:phosphatidylserine/phosphatidylglycerophosphate/cardiolipin synthase-like enzyme
MKKTDIPPREAFTPEEWAIVKAQRTPERVQRWLTRLSYNWLKDGITQRSFREVVRRREAHCMEAALAAAVILEQHGYPPLVLSLASQDKLDHVVFLFERDGRWGAVGRSRDTGLHGRRPVFRNPRQLAWSYHDPYVDYTGRITGYAVADMRELGSYDWRFSTKNIWRAERLLQEIPHRALRCSERRYRRLLARYKEFARTHPGEPPTYFDDRETWML